MFVVCVCICLFVFVHLFICLWCVRTAGMKILNPPENQHIFPSVTQGARFFLSCFLPSFSLLTANNLNHVIRESCLKLNNMLSLKGG